MDGHKIFSSCDTAFLTFSVLPLTVSCVVTFGSFSFFFVCDSDEFVLVVLVGALVAVAAEAGVSSFVAALSFDLDSSSFFARSPLPPLLPLLASVCICSDKSIRFRRITVLVDLPILRILPNDGTKLYNSGGAVIVCSKNLNSFFELGL